LRVVAHSLAALSALAAAPLALAALAVRRGWREGAEQRLGVVPRITPGSVWVHASSVGEVRAAVRLIEALARQRRRVFASTSTLTGRALLRASLPEVPSALAPVDHLWCVESALARVRPELLVLIETELWPSWIAAAGRRGIPVAVISGRLSDRSFPRYRRLRRLFAPTLRRLDAVGARSPLDAERFAALGVPRERIELTGDLKLEPPEVAPTLAADLTQLLSRVPVFVAGSTHPGEEETAVAVLERCRRQGLAAAAVVAPRHLERVPAAERALRAAGLAVRRRSRLTGPPIGDGEILLLDTLGELPGVYSVAAAAFVGGTLVPVGGHNLIEPVLAGCPVIFGPHVANAREHAEIALQSGAGEQVQSADGVAAVAFELLRDPAAGKARAACGRKALEAHRGSLARSLALVTRLLSAARSAAVAPATGREE
jgi:3-deoxy-D-manno-octulosonic-acid transferase